MTENKIKSVRKYWEFYTDMALQSYDWQQYKYSVQSLSAVIAARKTWGIKPYWSNHFYKITGYWLEDIEEWSEKLYAKYKKFFWKSKQIKRPKSKLMKAKSNNEGSQITSSNRINLEYKTSSSRIREKTISIAHKVKRKINNMKENEPVEVITQELKKASKGKNKSNDSWFNTNPLHSDKSFNLEKGSKLRLEHESSHYGSQIEEKRPVSRTKGYQTTTISMSRKNSLKSIETSNQRVKFKSFLKQPTIINSNCAKTKLRIAKSNNTYNSSRISERRHKQNKMMRKRRKYPSESIDSTRNGTSKYGATLKLFSSWTNTHSKENQSFHGSIVCHKKFENNRTGKPMTSPNVSHNEIENKTSRLKQYKLSATSWGMTFDHTNNLPSKPNTLLHGSLISRRPSGIVRPKTSIGRNHSLYANPKKYNNSCIESKPSVEHFITHRSNLEEGTIEVRITESLKDTQEDERKNETDEIDGSEQGRPRLTKNYSLKTIFEKKRFNNKDFIKNNITYVNQLSSKLKNRYLSPFYLHYYWCLSLYNVCILAPTSLI